MLKKHLAHMTAALLTVLVIIMIPVKARAVADPWINISVSDYFPQRSSYYYYNVQDNYSRVIQRFDPYTNSLIMANGGVDGYFGTSTKNAVIHFQEEYGFSSSGCDGIVGLYTWRAIWNQCFMTAVDSYNCQYVTSTLSSGSYTYTVGSSANIIRVYHRTDGYEYFFWVYSDGSTNPAYFHSAVRIY